MVQKNLRGRPRKDDAARITDRQGLVDVAVVILREGGAAALSARAVAERAGTAVGTVYTSFDNLEALRLEANAVTMRLLRSALTEALTGCASGSTEDRLLCLADAYLRFAAANHHAWAAIFEKRTSEPPPAMAADISALFGTLEKILQDGDLLDGSEVTVMARALWSSVHGMVFLGEVGGLGPIGRDDIRPMVEALVRATVQGLRAARLGKSPDHQVSPG